MKSWNNFQNWVKEMTIRKELPYLQAPGNPFNKWIDEGSDVQSPWVMRWLLEFKHVGVFYGFDKCETTTVTKSYYFALKHKEIDVNFSSDSNLLVTNYERLERTLWKEKVKMHNVISYNWNGVQLRRGENKSMHVGNATDGAKSTCAETGIAFEPESFSTLHQCSKGLGHRPLSHTPEKMGTTCEPWMTRCSIETLSKLVKSSMHALEWSSGSSTIWFLERVATLHTIEHDLKWLNNVRDYVRDRMGKSFSDRCTYVHVAATKLVTKGSEDDVWNDDGGTNYNFKNYVLKAIELPRKKFDIISIDGRARSQCLKLMLDNSLLVSSGGILILDNAERSVYANATLTVPKWWNRYDFPTDVDTTTIWISKEKEVTT